MLGTLNNTRKHMAAAKSQLSCGYRIRGAQEPSLRVRYDVISVADVAAFQQLAWNLGSGQRSASC